MKKGLIVGVILLILAGFAVFYFFMMPKELIVQIENPLDDGAVYVLTEYGPSAGYTWGNGSGVLVGHSKGGPHNVTSRALYRFNIAEWQGGDITLHLYCILITGSPGKIEIYVISDFGRLPENQTGDPHDVSEVWNKYQTGQKVAELTPESESWFEVVISADIVSSYISDDGFIAFMVKLQDESVEPGNFYGLLTSEYASENNMDPPYLSWKE